MRSFVIANGTSRKNFDLNQIKDKGKTYGCNALYRDFTPDYIGAIDRPMVDEMVREGAWQNSKMICKHIYSGSFEHFPRAKLYVKSFKQALGYDRHYDTGQTMLDYASIHLKEGEIYLLGFDLTNYMIENQRVHQNKIDNVYAGTDCYASVDAVEKYSGKWVRQMKIVFNNNPNITYYRVGATIIPETFKNIINIQHINYDKMMEKINESK
jgi:hypothetical protein